MNLQLTSLLSDIGLNIQEAHAFSTVDGYSLDVFVVDGWSLEVFYFFFKYCNELLVLGELSFRSNKIYNNLAKVFIFFISHEGWLLIHCEILF